MTQPSAPKSHLPCPRYCVPISPEFRILLRLSTPLTSTEAQSHYWCHVFSGHLSSPYLRPCQTNSNASFPIPFESFPIPRPCPSFSQTRPLGTTYFDLCILGARTYIQATCKQPVIKSTTHLRNVVGAPTWQPSTVHHPPSEDMAEARWRTEVTFHKVTGGCSCKEEEGGYTAIRRMPPVVG
jgi:hypothetical protein